MHKHLLVLLCLTAFCCASSVLATQSEQPAMGKILGRKTTEFPSWFKESFLEIAEDVAEAAQQDRHLILFFHLDFCPYCNKMIEENFKTAPYEELIQEHFDVIVINIRGAREVAFNDELILTESELADRLGVRYTPTILFLDQANQVVLRLNGYRSAQAFEYALDFVHEKAYRSTNLPQYIEDQAKTPVYELRENPAFTALSDLHQVAGQPLAVLFEDRSCDECDSFHDEILALPQTQQLLERLTVVRLDAFSDRPIVDPSGKPSTPKGFAQALAINYRPGVVLFDRNREIIRIDGMLRGYHFQQVLRYVVERHYEQYPDFSDYRRASSQEILKSGRDIDLWK